MSKKVLEKSKTVAKVPEKTKVDMVFSKQNYMLTGLAFIVVVIGFLLMYGGKEDIFSDRRITVAPIVVIIGFIIGVFAIMHKPKTTNGAD
jgi:uncharacterized membrane protein